MLLVGRYVENSKFFVEMLKKEFPHVEMDIVETGQRAFSALGYFDYQIVVTDHNLILEQEYFIDHQEDHNGQDVLERAKSKNRETVTVMIYKYCYGGLSDWESGLARDSGRFADFEIFESRPLGKLQKILREVVWQQNKKEKVMEGKKCNKECKCHYEVIINGEDKGCGCSKKNGTTQDQKNKQTQTSDSERVDGHA